MGSACACAQCLLPVGTTTGHFLSRGWGSGREVVAPLTTEEVGGLAGHPDQCPLAAVQEGVWYGGNGGLRARISGGAVALGQLGCYAKSSSGAEGSHRHVATSN